MPITVDVPDLGEVEFPDSMPQDDIEKAIKSHLTSRALDIAVKSPVEASGRLLGTLSAGAEGADMGRRQTAKEALQNEMAKTRIARDWTDALQGLTGGAQSATELVSQMDPINVLKRTMDVPAQLAGSPLRVGPVVSPEQVRQFILPTPETPGSFGEGVAQGGSELLSGFTSPDQAAALVAGKAYPEAVARLFQVGSASQIPGAAQQLGEAIQSGEPSQVGRAGFGLGTSVAIPALIEKGVRDAQGIRTDTGRVREAGPATETGQETRSDDLQQPPPGPPQPVGQGEEAKAQVAPTVTETTPPAKEIPSGPSETGLKPAIRLVGGDVVVGEAGQTHPDIIKRDDLKATDVDQRGFVDEQGKFLDREQAATATQLPTSEPQRLHSTDLPEAKTTPPAAVTEGESSTVPATSAATEVGGPAPTTGPAKAEPTIRSSTEQVPIQGMGGAVPGEFTPSQQSPTGIRNAIVDQERVKRGLPPAAEVLKRSFGEVWDQAMAKIDQDPSATDELIGSLKLKPRALNDVEDAMLLQRQVDLQNEYAKATRDLAQAHDDGRTDAADAERLRVSHLSDKLLELYNVGKKAGTETARGLNARRMLANEDFTLAHMELEQRAAKGGKPLTDTERAQITELHDKIAKTQKAYDDYVAQTDARLADLENKAKVAELSKQPEIPAPILQAAERLVKSLDTRADAARTRLSEKMTRFSAGVDPTILVDLAEIGAAHIARVGLDFAKWSARMLEEVGGSWHKDLPSLEDVYKASQKGIDSIGKVAEQVKSTVKKGFSGLDIEGKKAETVRQVKEKTKEGDMSGVSPLAQRIAKAFVAEGVTDREKLIDAVHGVLAEAVPDITRRQAMDAISGYGDFKQLSKDEISVKLRGMKGEMQQLAKIEDIESKKPALKTGIERRTPTDEERRLIAKVEEAKRRYGVVTTNPETQIKSALETRKTYYRNRISDLQAQIEKREKFVKERTPSPTDPELESLKAQQKELKKQFDDVFGKPGTTNEQYQRMLELDKKHLEDSISEKERQLREGDVAPKTQPQNRPAHPMLEELKQRRDELNRQITNARKTPEAEKYANELKRRLEDLNNRISDKETQLRTGVFPERAQPQNRPLATQELEAAKQRLEQLNKEIYRAKKPLKSDLDKLKSIIQSRIKNYEDRIAKGDYATKPKREITLDSEAMRLKADLERTKKKFKEGVDLERFKNRPFVTKGADWLTKLRRWQILSSPVSLAKLTAAALERLGSTATEEAIGGVIGKAIPGVAERAPREGGFSAKTEVDALHSAVTQGMKDAWSTLRTGRSDLDAIYGTRRAPENAFVDFWGRLHGMLKAPVKRSEFTRSLKKRMEFAANQGVDVSNPLVELRLGVEAYKDANRSIFLNSNRVVDAMKAGLARLEAPDKATGKPILSGKAGATAARIALPIVRVPTNIVAEAMQYAFGSVTGLARLGRAYAKGIETLRPEEADLIMRSLKKGSLGAAGLTLGFLRPDLFGGYYAKGEKRRKDQPEFGSIKVFGHNIPSFLLHHPLVEVAQLGATIRRVAEETLPSGQKKGIPAGLIAGALGVGEQVPFIREMTDWAKVQDQKTASTYFGELGRALIVPQALQWAAQHYDTDSRGNPIKRKPTTFTEHLKVGVPGLRQEVPQKR